MEIPLLGALLRGLWMIWTAIRDRPQVKYVGNAQGFVQIMAENLIIQPTGKLRNEGKQDTVIQEAWVDMNIAEKKYVLTCERGWSEEFIGYRIRGNGGQVSIYPNFAIFISNIPNFDINKIGDVILTIQVWPNTSIVLKLTLMQSK